MQPLYQSFLVWGYDGERERVASRGALTGYQVIIRFKPCLLYGNRIQFVLKYKVNQFIRFVTHGLSVQDTELEFRLIMNILS